MSILIFIFSLILLGYLISIPVRKIIKKNRQIQAQKEKEQKKIAFQKLLDEKQQDLTEKRSKNYKARTDWQTEFKALIKNTCRHPGRNYYNSCKSCGELPKEMWQTWDCTCDWESFYMTTNDYYFRRETKRLTHLDSECPEHKRKTSTKQDEFYF